MHDTTTTSFKRLNQQFCLKSVAQQSTSSPAKKAIATRRPLTAMVRQVQAFGSSRRVTWLQVWQQKLWNATNKWIVTLTTLEAMQWNEIDKLQTTTLFDTDANTNKPTRKMHLPNSALSAATSFSAWNRAAVENHWPLCVANMRFLGKSTATPSCIDTPWWRPRSPAMSTWSHRKQILHWCYGRKKWLASHYYHCCASVCNKTTESLSLLTKPPNAITGTSKLSRTYCRNHPQLIFSVGGCFRQHVKSGLKADFSQASLRRLNWSIVSIAN